MFNEEEGSLYVHHDMLLSSYPLCMEWLDFDPGPGCRSKSRVAHVSLQDQKLLATSSQSAPWSHRYTIRHTSISCLFNTAQIEVWDLDVVDAPDPAFVLGEKRKPKKGVKRVQAITIGAVI